MAGINTGNLVNGAERHLRMAFLEALQVAATGDSEQGSGAGQLLNEAVTAPA